MAGVIKAKSVHLSQIAERMNKGVEPESNLRRLHRLLDEVSLEPSEVLSFIQSEVTQPGKERGGQAKLKLSLDRSEWGIAGQKNNILTLALAYKNIALPLLVQDLDKAGCSNRAERLHILECLLECVALDRVEVLTADREFASVAFLGQLVQCKVNFALRITADTLITVDGFTQAARLWFGSTARNAARSSKFKSTALPSMSVVNGLTTGISLSLSLILMPRKAIAFTGNAGA